MKKWASILTLVCIIALILVSQNVSASNRDNFISVRITRPIKSPTKVKISSDNGFYIYKMDNLSKGSKISDEKELTVTLENNGKILLRDTSNNAIYTFDKNNELITSNNKVITVEGSKYRDYITFKEIKNQLGLINYVDLENYLYGVIPAEMPASWEKEALKAQAVAARTYTIKNINKHSGDGYNLCDQTHCQVYGGMNAEKAATNQALNETKGIVATYNGKPIDALYHSNSGGYTANAGDVWSNNIPYLVAVKDDYSLNQPSGTWEKTYTSDEISKYFNVGKVIDVKVLDRTSPDGRADNIKIIGTNGEETISGSAFRTRLGVGVIPSTMFEVTRIGESVDKGSVSVISANNPSIESIDLNSSYVIDGNGNIYSAKDANSVITKDGIARIEHNNSSPNEITFVFHGKGYGHGVGMSQWGAQGMAQQGKNYEQILKHYYTGIRIETIN